MMNIPKLEPVMILENKVSICLPDGVCDMEEKRVGQLYPMKAKPQSVKLYGDEICWFSFLLLSKPLCDKSIEENLRVVQQQFERLCPSMIAEPLTSIHDTGIINKMYISIVSKGVMAETYQMMYLLPVRGEFMLGTACCDVSQQEDWKDIFKKVIVSAQDLTSTWEYHYDQKNLLTWIETYYKEHPIF